MKCLIDLFPNPLQSDSSVIGCYVQQLLMCIQYVPELRPQIIQLVIEKMILIDVEMQKQAKSGGGNQIGDCKHEDDSLSLSSEHAALELSDDEEDEDRLKQNLDQLMCLMFDYIKIIADDDAGLFNELYQTLSRIFENTILSTHEVKICVVCLCLFARLRDEYTVVFMKYLMILNTDAISEHVSFFLCFLYVLT